ncbi:ubiquinone/menaquinone biosynthesis C-methylase UbiE [Kribbella voronezhensis]|uniref:Ubiquinone/menaquinone biosynthesis C-methylase UbiE n=1 Tax=Kribbella voronezhensis TaxID=2512212 RepID=A0A4R7TGS2_9ACTN|nr:class I SAM-dependent methyltransferase [Kribbella voronezhensis]TDU91481.1 ubiquinone/menaquinone biosynthesis C-methylase UbiE [Kribbella voronezhensis]
MVDALFGDGRLVGVYDALDPDRGDLEAYVGMVGEFGARSVLDVGCGTGELARLLVEAGVEVVGVDPALASLEVARGKVGAEKVRWIHGDATGLPPLQVELAVMTGNVAQVFLSDEEWMATLYGVRAALVPGGRFVFETRDPARRAWLEWNREATYKRIHVPGVGGVENWTDLLDVKEPFVTFRSTYVFESDGARMTSESTLRFRTRAEVEESLSEAGFAVADVRDAPDRPGKEFVFVAEGGAARVPGQGNVAHPAP